MRQQHDELALLFQHRNQFRKHEFGRTNDHFVILFFDLLALLITQNADDSNFNSVPADDFRRREQFIIELKKPHVRTGKKFPRNAGIGDFRQNVSTREIQVDRSQGDGVVPHFAQHVHRGEEFELGLLRHSGTDPADVENERIPAFLFELAKKLALARKAAGHPVHSRAAARFQVAV